MRTSPRPRAARTGRLRFVASLGILAFAGVSVTAASVTDSTVAALTPVGGTFDVAFADAAGTPLPQGAVYVVPAAEISGPIHPLDSTAAVTDAHFPLRIVNRSTGSIGAHVTLAFQSMTTAAPDVFSKLQVQVVDPADPAHPLLPWTPTTAGPVVSVDLDGASARTRTLHVQLRLAPRSELDGRYYGAPLDLGITMNGESS